MNKKNKNSKYAYAHNDIWRKPDFYTDDRYGDLYNKNNNIYQDCLTESDFYPPSDDRILQSYVEDIEGGDNFADYCEYIFELYEEEGYYD